MKNIKRALFLGFGATTLFFASCADELETKPKVELSLENLLQQDPNAAIGLLSKMYGTLALSGPNGAGSSDIAGPDPGETAFLRGLINLQDFTADAMKNRWGDDGLDQLTTTSNWTANNKFFVYMYDRLYYIIPQATSLMMALEQANVPESEQISRELRFIRAIAYYYMIDCFGKGVLVNETNYGTTEPLPEATRAELFEYVESELLAIEPDFATSNSYGRATKSAVQFLLARLYLNAEGYSGTARYADALTYSGKVIDEGGYSLAPNFGSLFTADNNNNTEIILPLIADALLSQSWGNTTYLVNGSLGTETMPLADFGATEGWSGHRATKAWYGLFGDLGASTDDRADLFWTTGHNYEMTDYKLWIDGYPSTKFRNTNFSGPSIATQHSSTDFPMFRLADAYLMYAECVARGAGGSASQAVGYVNQIRSRAHASTISQSDLTLEFILDERARELNFEGVRRMDLIRFGKFTGGSYVWPWKGNVLNGTSIPSTYNVFPIPQAALQANPNLSQNPGY